MNFIFFHVSNVFFIVKPRRANLIPGAKANSLLQKQTQINSTKLAY